MGTEIKFYTYYTSAQGRSKWSCQYSGCAKVMYKNI